ncbi:TF-B3 domain-containing protein [Abeliophyllum distichum]|uniref:TF-B3 domain-containing protein n=1 Tax=Abeliophyllum distichum TaxID=126358 RepID=A0ABD1UHA5_9LAMI
MADLKKEEITTLIGEPFYNLVLSKSNIHPLYDMSFPPTLDSLLPSTTVLSIIRSFGKMWEVKFLEKGDLRALIPVGERKFVDDNNLVARDAIVFELLESTSIKVVFKVQILICTIPPKLQELINKRRAESESMVIDDDE